MRSFATNRALTALVLLTGCGTASYEVDRVENVQRAATIWHGHAEGAPSPHLCLEFSTAAHELMERNASLKVPLGAELSAEATYQSSASLAQIYTVSDIMQFGHSTLYRLCEAAGNGTLTKEQYAKLVEDVLDNIKQLLELQITGSRVGVLQQVIGARREIQDISDGLAKLKQKPSTDLTSDDVTHLQERLADARERYRILLKTHDLTGVFEHSDPLKELISQHKARLEKLEAEKSELAKTPAVTTTVALKTEKNGLSKGTSDADKKINDEKAHIALLESWLNEVKTP